MKILKQAEQWPFRIAVDDLSLLNPTPKNSSPVTVYRGLSIPRRVRRADVLNYVKNGDPKEGGFGPHWTTHPGVAHWFADGGFTELGPSEEISPGYRSKRGVVISAVFNPAHPENQYQARGIVRNQEFGDPNGYPPEHGIDLWPGTIVTVNSVLHNGKELLSAPFEGMI